MPNDKVKLKLTDSQDLAIHYDTPKNVLVSASAGSGKTFVMTNRIIEKVRKGVPLSSLFISTFTVKAAAELKNRIESAIKNELRSDGNSVEVKQVYSQALQDLPLATIGTTDAFVNSFVKEYYNVVQVDPNFRVLTDVAEQNLIKNQIFSELVEEHLSVEQSERFEKLAKNFSNDRNINGFKNIVYKVYSYCQSTVNVEKWLDENFLLGFEKFSKYGDLPESLMNISSVQEDFKELMELFQLGLDKKALSKNTAENVSYWIEAASYLFEVLSSQDFSNFSELINGLKENAKLNGNNFKGKDAKELGLQDKFYQVMGGGAEKLQGSVPALLEKVRFAELVEGYHESAKLMLEDLRDFILEFAERYMKKKRDLSAFEFSDILHFALEILESEEHPEILQLYQQKYSEIMIDEYQDTNQAQEKLYQLLSNGYNMFMVGDIKQSIYGFRQADPSLFQHKYDSFPQDESDERNRLLLLQENFRSRREVLDFTNDVFVKLMSSYSESERLVFPNRDGALQEKFDEDYQLPSFISPEAELLLYSSDSPLDSDKSSDSTEADTIELTNGEIELAASKIIRLINNKIAPKDIALLVRTKSNNEKIKEIFESHNIPVVLDDVPENYLKSIEIQVMLDVLRAVNNPLFDISLVATLHSPLFGFTEDDLAKISLQKGENFWEKLHSETLQLDSQLYSKLISFEDTFVKWRNLSAMSAVHELINQIYLDSFYMEYVGALPNGEQRQANLQALMSRALSYESNGYKGLVKFIDMIDNYLQQENDLVDVNNRLPQNAVRVQTIHKSKGLEFDYVFIMNFNTKFSMQDFRSDILLDKELGAGIKFTADLSTDKKIISEFPHALVKMETIPYLVNKQRMTQQIIEEEMRMLYVAFTRAKKKLYMVGKVNKSDEIEKEASLNLEKLPRKGYLTWILALLNFLTEQKKSLIFDGVKTTVNFNLDEEIHLNVLSDLEANQSNSSWKETLEVGRAFVEAKKLMEFDGYNLEATKLSSTLSPSMLERQIRQYDEESIPEKNFEFKLDMLDSKVYSSADRGTVVHSFMQHIDFTNLNLFNLQQELDEMNLPEELKEAIDIPKILTLFETNLGRAMIKNAANLRLEQPFSMLKTIENKGKVIDQTVVRGIIDGYYIEDDSIVLFDYKTDRFEDSSQIEEIKSQYIEQQELYAEALAKANSGRKVEKYLILLGGPDRVEIARL
ncbi:MAG: helicase-exonuclease AddAB subunit AddA [Streptococcaceae bacterium]|jgi:ATP-dependent helicase/nuclease subunit A|nr:helicase-exonuclease AddAB subunit AddA [Streptococcaceae bacterium]